MIMSIIRHFVPAFNLSLRSIVHLFISGSLFYFFSFNFHIPLIVGIAGAFLLALANEIVEYKMRVENSFHTRHVFERDRLLVCLVLLYTTVIIKYHLVFATLAAPVSIMAITSFIDIKVKREKAEKRNLIKPIADIAAMTLGPVACMILIRFTNL